VLYVQTDYLQSYPYVFSNTFNITISIQLV